MACIDERFPPKISYGASGGHKFKTAIVQMAGGHEQRNIEWEFAKGEWRVGKKIRNQVELDMLNAFHHVCYGRAYTFRFKDWFDYRARMDASEELPLLLTTSSSMPATTQLVKPYTFGNWSYNRDIVRPVRHTIQGVSTTGKTFTIEGDYTDYFTQGRLFIVRGSTGNDGQYTVTASRPGGDDTVITVQETLPDGTADGEIETVVLFADGTDIDPADYTLDFSTGIITWDSGYNPGAGVRITWDGAFDCHCRFDLDWFNPAYQAFKRFHWEGIPIIEVPNEPNLV